MKVQQQFIATQISQIIEVTHIQIFDANPWNSCEIFMITLFAKRFLPREQNVFSFCNNPNSQQIIRILYQYYTYTLNVLQMPNSWG